MRICASLTVLLASLALLGPAIGKAAAPTTVVSLTFDDGPWTQYDARPLLANHGTHGMFYVNSGLVASGPGEWHMT